MGAAIITILEHARESERYHFHVLDGGISADNQAKLSSLLREGDCVSYIPVSPGDFESCPLTGYVEYISLATYYRFKIPSYLPELDKVLYLDCDVIANSNVADLYATELGEHFMAAVPEVYQQDHTQRLQYRANEWYCNAGVMLINNRKWREEDIETQLFTYAVNPKRPIIYQDQDIINEVLKYNILYLPLHWNLQHCAIFRSDSYPWHEPQRLQAKAAPRIVHFSDRLKPWSPGCPNPHTALYRNALRKSPWSALYDKLCAEERHLRLRRFLWNSYRSPDGAAKQWSCLGLPILKKHKKDAVRSLKILGIPLYKTVRRTGVYKLSILGIRVWKQIKYHEILCEFIPHMQALWEIGANLKAIVTQHQEWGKLFHETLPHMQAFPAISAELKAIEAQHRMLHNTSTRELSLQNSSAMLTRKSLLAELYLERLYQKNKEKTYDIQSIIKNTKSLVLSCWSAPSASMFENLAAVFDVRSFSGTFEKDFSYADCYCIWGTQAYDGLLETLLKAELANRPLLICEGGFISCIENAVGKHSLSRYHQTLSFLMDDLAPYYDARRRTRLEDMLNDPGLVIGEPERRRAEQVINRILEHHVTKYNNQPIFTPQLGRADRQKVLVVDQSFGDMSILKGGASDATFTEMLDSAIRENPEADIIVKTHPDTIAGARGYYTQLTASEQIYPYTEPINPISLIKAVDKVYVCSSQLGFEAVLAGKEVHVFGMPFYAGWGVTYDRQREARRTQKRSVLEIFYITYILYTHYVSFRTHRACEIEEAIDNILELREQYFQKRGIRNELSAS